MRFLGALLHPLALSSPLLPPLTTRGHARTYLKDLEALRPTIILGAPPSLTRATHLTLTLLLFFPDIIHSGEALAVTDAAQQTIAGSCSRCGYIASGQVCKACLLLEGLNKGMPQLAIGRRCSEIRDLPAAPELEAAHRPVASIEEAAQSFAVAPPAAVVEPLPVTARRVANDW